jgi:hypothetical protein
MGLEEAMDLHKRLYLQQQENSKSLFHLTAEQVQRLLKHECCQKMYKTIGNILLTSSMGCSHNQPYQLTTTIGKKL